MGRKLASWCFRGLGRWRWQSWRGGGGGDAGFVWFGGVWMLSVGGWGRGCSCGDGMVSSLVFMLGCMDGTVLESVNRGRAGRGLRHDDSLFHLLGACWCRR